AGRGPPRRPVRAAALALRPLALGEGRRDGPSERGDGNRRWGEGNRRGAEGNGPRRERFEGNRPRPDRRDEGRHAGPREDQRPPRRERAPDPDSPFAKLAALKAQLESGEGGKR
ncbi:hypothetical protein, partial [Methylobacterium soli]|uniref:hypothetical protein n=1 Tax=Methylobacterium soli TaxID=553447 RepID=UPI001EE29BC5